ncbi:MAG: oxygen-independent coproporphyrinogen III oxidase [Porphyromonadaceae bacterium]|nr:MAG: oxygen-independent coproporphyrinogen III oxidase [Porphyromonadaceae bacterium]
MKIRKDLILKYNQAGPRYTSYPPANYFHEGIAADDFKRAISQSNHERPQNISLYVHIPFCPRLCHFCGCTTSGSKDINVFRSYIDALKTEISQVAQLLDPGRSVTQIHWGGGTPNSIPLDMVQEVMDLFRSHFKIEPHAEIAMECSPAYLEFEDIDRLAAMGFNRLSLGIQDFNDDVLKNVNREPSKHPVDQLANRMNENGFKGLNLDLIYGLPGQTPENFKKSIEKAIEVNPNRLATFSYAHVPWVKKAQSVLEEIGIPSAGEKLALMEIAYGLLTENGYMSIGMDHYAKPDDDLYQAFLDKQLHRNFQGYCTRATTGQVYGFGCSSISQLDSGYYQNKKTIKGYIESIGNTGWAVERGYQVNTDEKITRTVINEVMCNLFVDFNEIGKLFGKDAAEVKEIVGYDVDKLALFLADNLLGIKEEKIKINADGSLVIRNIAMTFDPQLSVNQNQYSKTI